MSHACSCKVNSPTIPGYPDLSVEDPTIWQADGHYQMVAKVFKDIITGNNEEGFYAYSKNGIRWSIHENPKAYSRTVTFEDGTQRTQKKLERPQVLVQDGIPTHLFFATADPEWADIYNLAIPIKPPKS